MELPYPSASPDTGHQLPPKEPPSSSLTITHRQSLEGSHAYSTGRGTFLGPRDVPGPAGEPNEPCHRKSVVYPTESHTQCLAAKQDQGGSLAAVFFHLETGSISDMMAGDFHQPLQ